MNNQKPICHTSSDHLCDLYVLSIIYQLIIIDHTAHPCQAFKLARTSLSNHPSNPLTLHVLTFKDAALDPPLLSYLPFY